VVERDAPEVLERFKAELPLVEMIARHVMRTVAYSAPLEH
jgi:hypothetical protein